MKFSPVSFLLLCHSIGKIDARIGNNILPEKTDAPNDLDAPDEGIYAGRDPPDLLRVPYWPPGKEQVATKIVGGVEVDPKDRYPYQVALTFSSGRQYCGGSLIAPGWVLSAAHCADYGSRVQIGRWDLDDNSEDYEDIEVDYELVHPDYDYSSFDNDFMLLKLKTDSQYPPVSVNDGSQTTDAGTDVTTIGWGRTSSQGAPSDVLLEVEVDIVGNTECNLDYDGGITENMLCAARLGKDACQGDSGGPLVIRGNSYSEDVLVGVVSWGYGCASPNYPGVYASVSKGYNWISKYVSFDEAIDKEDPLFPDDFKWSSGGIPSGYDCTQIHEGADPHTWHDNYFCWKKERKDPGMKWSSAGPISGMRCTQILENSDPHTWHDNYLCVPHSSPLHFSWSSAGPIKDASCIQWHESADPHTWDDNYLCSIEQEPDYFSIRNPTSGLVLDIPGGDCIGGTNVIVWEFHGGDNQLFYYGPNDTIMSKKCNMALDVNGNACDNGENLIIWEAHGGQNQAFEVNNNGSIVSLSCNKVIDMYKHSTQGSKLNMWHYHGDWNQVWMIE